ncbi:predicted protein [Botrytis cinerea T4]|uniref:Uncharacterized protein n=1 Tax=Botryotinia fuckeliana (strain T4) TaxID=999810 RepID=G2YMV5_BOTF4|nr:predicted protein [Botrytis cinerea T4]
MDESTLSKREKKRLRFFKKFGSRCTIPKPWSEAGTAAAGLRDAGQMTEEAKREIETYQKVRCKCQNWRLSSHRCGEGGIEDTRRLYEPNDYDQ